MIYVDAKSLRFYELRTSWKILLALSRSTFRFFDNAKTYSLKLFSWNAYS